MSKAVVLAVAGREGGGADIIALTDTAILFGIAQPLPGGSIAQWHRIILETGANRALAITSWLAGHEEPIPMPHGLAAVLTGPSVEFVHPGDFFEVDVKGADSPRLWLAEPHRKSRPTLTVEI